MKQKPDNFTLNIQGACPIRFEGYNSRCGDAKGLSIRVGNDWANERLRGYDGFSAGGVADKKDLKNLAEWILERIEED